MTVVRRRSRLPLLGPGAELLKALASRPLDDLRALAEGAGLELPDDATPEEVASRIVREKFRLGTNELYHEGDDTYLNVDEYYPFLVEFIARLGPRRVTELGCGTGKLARLLQPVLPPDGRYLGTDFAEVGIERARQKVQGDARYEFGVADAVEAPILEDSDCVLYPWVMNWLDTHAADGLWARLAAVRPAPLVVACVAFRACVERRHAVTRDDARELAAAEAYLRGDRAAADAIWHTERFAVYVQSLHEHFQIVEEAIRPGAHIFWTARSRSAQALRPRG